jgi:site-specific DNA-adenine methylase
MFSYYGSKSKIAKYYPKPIYDKIIEPFCGGAYYSLYSDNWKKEICLYDKYELIINLWKYLIQAKESDILKLPDLKYKQNIDDFSTLIQEEKHLIGFFINGGSAMPKKTAQKYNCWNENKRKQISADLHKIRHWKVKCKEYNEIPNIEATFFIDPPYSGSGGTYYRHGCKNINYENLAEFCKTRLGQVIVCENSECSNWLPFRPLVEISGQLHKTKEVIWTNSAENIKTT